jgi:hypothetical protein
LLRILEGGKSIHIAPVIFISMCSMTPFIALTSFGCLQHRALWGLWPAPPEWPCLVPNLNQTHRGYSGSMTLALTFHPPISTTGLG